MWISWRAGSHDTDLSCYVPFYSVCCTALRDYNPPTLQTDRRTDGRHAGSISTCAKTGSNIDILSVHVVDYLRLAGACFTDDRVSLHIPLLTVSESVSACSDLKQLAAAF